MKCLSFVLILLVVCGHGAYAQQDSVPDRPFVVGGAYDKPYLTTLAGRTAIGGYAEAHAKWNRVDGVTEESGFEARRFNLFTATEVSDFIRIGAELEIEEGGEEITLEFASIDFRVHPSFNLRAGMLLSPLGRFNLSHDSPLNDFTDRPLVSTEIIGTTLSEPGLGLFGTFRLGGLGRATYEVYATNGFQNGLLDGSPEGTRIPLGRVNVEDNNSSPAFVGRVTWSPSFDVELGVSGHHGSYNEFNREGIRVEDPQGVHIWVLDFSANVSDWEASGELATASIGIPDGLAGFSASSQRGAYVDILRAFGRGWIATMPRSSFAAAVRFDLIDFDADLAGDDRYQITIGINFRPTAESALKLGYVRGRGHDRFNNPADHAGLQFSLATYF